MEGGGLEHMVLSIAACAIAVLLGLSAFAVPGRSERSSPMFVLATPPGGTYFDFVVSILMENHGICDILTYCGGSAPFVDGGSVRLGLPGAPGCTTIGFDRSVRCACTPCPQSMAADKKPPTWRSVGRTSPALRKNAVVSFTTGMDAA